MAEDDTPGELPRSQTLSAWYCATPTPHLTYKPVTRKEKREAAIEMVKAGVTISETARQIGLTRYTVQRICKRYGLRSVAWMHTPKAHRKPGKVKLK